MPALALLTAALALHNAQAQDAARGARLYLGLPAGLASCVDCHGPDPGLDRNRLLNAAQGPAAIDVALRKAAAMGYLADQLSSADKADLSAWLAQVLADMDGSAAATVWPWSLEFGSVAPGAVVAPQDIRLRNRSSVDLALSPRLRSLAPGGAAGLTLSHDCPTTLPPGGDCTAQAGLVAGAEGGIQAALEWGDGAAALRPVGLAATVSLATTGMAQWRDGAPDAALTLDSPAGAAASWSLPLQNTGPVAITLGVPAITGPGRTAFRIDAGGCAAQQVLAPGEQCVVRVVGSATTPGRHEAVLQWRTDGSHPPARRLDLRATAQAPLPAASAPLVPPATDPAAPGLTPLPAPTPSADLPSASGASGGCSVVAAAPSDPTLPALVALAAWSLWTRSRRPANGSQPEVGAVGH